MNPEPGNSEGAIVVHKTAKVDRLDTGLPKLNYVRLVAGLLALAMVMIVSLAFYWETWGVALDIAAKVAIGLVGMYGALLATRRVIVLERRLSHDQAEAWALAERAKRQRLDERLGEAAILLGHSEESTRIAGLLTLERLLQSEQFADEHWTIVQLLLSVVRGKCSTPRDSASGLPTPPAQDAQVALSIIGRRPRGREEGELRLDGLHLEGADLREAYLAGAYLSATFMTAANLYGAHLEDAILYDAHLENAVLMDTHLQRAGLTGATLQGAHLAGARLQDSG